MKKPSRQTWRCSKCNKSQSPHKKIWYWPDASSDGDGPVSEAGVCKPCFKELLTTLAERLVVTI